MTQLHLFDAPPLSRQERSLVALLASGGVLMDRRYNGWAFIPANNPHMAHALEEMGVRPCR